MADDPGRFGIDELADLGGVSRRTVRYYVQEGLLPAPLGVGRGRHYDQAHLDRLLQVKALQEAGRSLDEVRRLLAGPPASRVALRAPAPPPAQTLPRTTWRRVSLAPGIELHVSQDLPLPAPARLHELADWCRRHFPLPDPHED